MTKQTRREGRRKWKGVPGIRTISAWCIYNPAQRFIVKIMPSKYMLKPFLYPGCVVVQIKGTYAMPRQSPTPVRQGK